MLSSPSVPFTAGLEDGRSNDDQLVGLGVVFGDVELPNCLKNLAATAAYVVRRTRR